MKANIPGTKRAEAINRQIMLEVFIYAIALVLNDVLHFGPKRIQRIIKGLSEVLEGYADQDGATIVDGMKAELKNRGLEFDIVGRR